MALERGQLTAIVACSISTLLFLGLLFISAVYAMIKFRRRSTVKRVSSGSFEVPPPMLALSPSIGHGDLSISLPHPEIEPSSSMPARPVRAYAWTEEDVYVGRSITLTAIDEEAAGIMPLAVSASCLSLSSTTLPPPSPAKLATCRRVSLAPIAKPVTLSFLTASSLASIPCQDPTPALLPLGSERSLHNVMELPSTQASPEVSFRTAQSGYAESKGEIS